MARPHVNIGPHRFPDSPEQHHQLNGLGIAVGVRVHPGPVLGYDQEVLAAYANVETTIAADPANYWTVQLKDSDGNVVATVSSAAADIEAGTALTVDESKSVLAKGKALRTEWSSTGAPADLSAKRLSVTAVCTAAHVD